MIDSDFERLSDATIRLLDERTDGPRVCARCLGATERSDYFANDFYCEGCAERSEDFPWKTTSGGLAP